MQLIETTTTLQNFCQQINNENFICIDLEFLRRQTYFAKLCLIQVASPNESAIIDPLADNIDLKCFFELLQNPNIVKVFHSGRQDIEILYNLTSQIPTPCFDTQIAAMACGYGDSVSYENLVHHILGQTIDKTSRLSDWSKRPLSDNQLNYALSDVTHLVSIYLHLKKELEQNNRLSWIQEELATLTSPETYQIIPSKIWQKIRHRSHNARFLTMLRELAAWREIRCINKDVPRQSFIKDDILLNICSCPPSTKKELAAIQGIKPDIATGKIGDEILNVLQQTAAISRKDYVTPPKTDIIPTTESSLFELLKLCLRLVAQQHKVVPRLICSEEELKIFCHTQSSDVSFMTGWRYDLFGKIAHELCSGKLAISYDCQNNCICFNSTSK